MKIEPQADEQVLDFIIDFLCHHKNVDEQEVIRSQFRAGYCYHFAIILKNIFNRGEICWCAPYGHICWVDDNGVPYDIEGICQSDCEYFIPVSYIQEGLADFMHIKGISFNASQEYIDNAINRYKSDNNIID